MGFQGCCLFIDVKIDMEFYYVLNFYGGKMWRSRRNFYVDGYVGIRVEDGCGMMRYGSDGDGYFVRWYIFSGFRFRYVWKKVLECGNLFSSSLMECVYLRQNWLCKRVRLFYFNKSYDLDVECEYDVYGCDCDYGCYYECMECSDLILDGFLNSWVFDGVVFLFEYFNNWVFGVLSM